MNPLVRNAKNLRDAPTNGADAKGFGGVVASIHKVHPEFLRQSVRPVRPLSRDECIGTARRDDLNFRTSPAGDDRNAPNFRAPPRTMVDDGFHRSCDASKKRLSSA